MYISIYSDFACTLFGESKTYAYVQYEESIIASWRLLLQYFWIASEADGKVEPKLVMEDTERDAEKVI